MPTKTANPAARQPRLAVVLGDPAGIGPELIARLLAQPDVRARADMVLIADPAEFERGMDLAGLKGPERIAYAPAASITTADLSAKTLPLIVCPNPAGQAFERAKATAHGGLYSLNSLETALSFTTGGLTDGILFGPLNKTSLHMAGMAHNDELHWFAEQLGYHGPLCELNTLDGLWTSRATSHVAHADVSRLLTVPAVLDAISLMYHTLRMAGYASPRVAVCGLNPHNGDNGSFGHEELDVIAPAVELAAARGMPVSGPFPADTIFLKVFGATRGYDGVVTMYHDQGQIAIKLMGFSRGVTVQGGLPVPIATPAHGTAFDISQQGLADVGATRQAFEVVLAMASRYQAARTGGAV